MFFKQQNLSLSPYLLDDSFNGQGTLLTAARNYILKPREVGITPFKGTQDLFSALQGTKQILIFHQLSSSINLEHLSPVATALQPSGVHQNVSRPYLRPSSGVASCNGPLLDPGAPGCPLARQYTSSQGLPSYCPAVFAQRPSTFTSRYRLVRSELDKEVIDYQLNRLLYVAVIGDLIFLSAYSISWPNRDRDLMKPIFLIVKN